MGIMMSKDLRDKDELSERIAADLRERVQSVADEESDKSEVDELPGTKKTGRFAWVWMVLVILAVISIILILMI